MLSGQRGPSKVPAEVQGQVHNGLPGTAPAGLVCGQGQSGEPGAGVEVDGRHSEAVSCSGDVDEDVVGTQCGGSGAWGWRPNATMCVAERRPEPHVPVWTPGGGSGREGQRPWH